MRTIEINCDFCFNGEKNGQLMFINDVPYAVRSMIEKLFWFSSEELVNLHICPGCQDKLLDFFEFYSQVEGVYKQRLEKDRDEEKPTYTNDEATVEGTEDEIEIKLEPLSEQYSDEDDARKQDNKEPIPCTICGQLVKNQITLDIHMRGHTEASITITCKICGKQSPNARALRKHIKEAHIIRHAHPCTMCRKSFKTRHALKDHMAIHTGEMLYKCEFCDEQFYNSGNHSLHRKKMHAQEWEELKKSMPISRRGCPKKCQSLIQEERVKKSLHPCTLCKKNFKSRRGLKEHMSIHTGEMLYKCEFCDKQFYNSGNLSQHRRNIHPLEYQEHLQNKPTSRGRPKKY
ncbi:zinc finger protein 62 homolog [Uranotaenia lowii]|uniref:zinc finger protein 62 homolog n=1 Tax=Uranotaenia lowii TaxID=190385 RepID=UPI00247A6C68|nr:zinc finger protein 62 homolog [Uranotaenia lowii]